MMRNESAVLSPVHDPRSPQLGAWHDPVGSDATPDRLAYFAPLQYEARYAYPLIVWLHDRDGSHRELPRLMPHVSTRNYVAVALGDDRASGPWSQTPESTADAGVRIDQAIEAASERFSIHPERVFLAGCGIGGTMALRIGLGRPEAYAGVASFDAGLPRGRRPLGRLKALRNLPLLLGVNRDSRRYLADHVSEDLRLFHSAGCRLEVRQYPDDGPLCTAMLADFDRWMMALVCGAAATAAVASRA